MPLTPANSSSFIVSCHNLSAVVFPSGVYIKELYLDDISRCIGVKGE